VASARLREPTPVRWGLRLLAIVYVFLALAILIAFMGIANTLSLSINERIRVKILCDDLQQYESFLPVGAEYKRLTDLIFFYLGYRQEVEIQLGINSARSPDLALGKQGRLGWTSWMQRKRGTPPPYHFDAHFRV